MRKSDLDLLTSLGLSKSESIIYLDLIFNGLSSVPEIAQRINFHRTNVYDSLRRLKEIGIIIQKYEGSSKKFESIEPDKLKLYLKQREDELEKFIDDLKKIPKKNFSDETLVSVFEGISINREFLNALNLKKTFFVAMDPEFQIIDNNFFNIFNERRIKNKIPMKIIFSKNHPKISKFDSLKYLQYKIIPFATSKNLITIIVDNCLYYLQKKYKKYNLIKINNYDISKERKFHFDHAWNMK